MSAEIPWDAPSRYGRVGLQARRALQRVLRPLTVRLDAERDEVQSRLTQVGAQTAGRLSHLEHALERGGTYATTVNEVAWRGAVLLRDLPPGTRTRRVASEGSSRAICSLATGLASVSCSRVRRSAMRAMPASGDGISS